jgi:beta-lactamase regulating signal transducer with metallopeptidase domain
LLDAVSWTLLHFLWQGTIVGVVLALLLPVVRNRYAAAAVALLTLAVTVSATLALQLASFDPGPQTVDGRIDSGAADATANVELRDSRGMAEVNRADPRDVKTPEVFADSVLADSVTTNAIIEDVSSLDPVSSVAPLATTLGSSSRNGPSWWQFWLVSGWLCGATLLVVRLSLQWRGVVKLRRSAVALLVGSSWQRLCAELSLRVRAMKHVQLLTSTTIHIPVAMGVLRPVIVVPLSMLSSLTPDQVDAILLHELGTFDGTIFW